ncbi:hypothetical protein L596_001308 [Steinernema carpocapsae]|uniref:Uncharacterized protein n=1 Tax=Steinernema carpocapsae TaxID=34508 RepID=A0A4U8UMX4_STECR|nr:hypothetical protein L596_001308 [Steinernema carpocapsae]
MYEPISVINLNENRGATMKTTLCGEVNNSTLKDDLIVHWLKRAETLSIAVDDGIAAGDDVTAGDLGKDEDFVVCQNAVMENEAAGSPGDEKPSEGVGDVVARLDKLATLFELLVEQLMKPVNSRFLKDPRVNLTIHWVRVYLDKNLTLDKNATYEFVVSAHHGNLAWNSEMRGIGELEAVRGRFFEIPLKHVFEYLPREFEISIEVHVLRVERYVKKSIWDPLRRLVAATPLRGLLAGVLQIEKKLKSTTLESEEGFNLNGSIKLTQRDVGMLSTHLEDPEFPLEGTIDLLSTLSLHPAEEGGFEERLI